MPHHKPSIHRLFHMVEIPSMRSRHPYRVPDWGFHAATSFMWNQGVGALVSINSSSHLVKKVEITRWFQGSFFLNFKEKGKAEKPMLTSIFGSAITLKPLNESRWMLVESPKKRSLKIDPRRIVSDNLGIESFPTRLGWEVHFRWHSSHPERVQPWNRNPIVMGNDCSTMLFFVDHLNRT